MTEVAFELAPPLGALSGRGRRLGALAVFFLFLAGPPTIALPPEYLPTSHWAYDDLLSLWDRGVVAELNVAQRPWTREEIARQLLGASGAAGDPVYDRLVREFSRELHWLGPSAAPRETPPLWTAREESSEVRVSVGVEGSASGSPLSQAKIDRLSGAFVRVHGYFPPDVYVGTEVRAQRVEPTRGIGDALILDEDLFLDSRESYLAARIGGFETTLGLTETRWGPGRSGTLLLSDAADEYPGLRIRRRIGPLDFCSLSGVLVAADHRHFASHRITLRLSPSLFVGVAEAARYDAESPQLLYVLNLVPYTLVERFTAKNQDTSPEISPRNNVMMSADVVWRPGAGTRIWAELLADDIATEVADMPHRFAWQVGAARRWSMGRVPFGLLLEHTKVFRYTYAVHYERDFIFGGRPLGYQQGPDVEQYALRLTADPSVAWSGMLDVTLLRAGEAALGESWNPSDPRGQWSGLDLTGTVETTVSAGAGAAWIPRDNVRLALDLGIEHVTGAGHIEGASRTDPSGSLRLMIRK